jgi:hypothetical protein
MAYVQAWEAFGQDEYLQTAKRVTKAILQQRNSTAGWVKPAIASKDISLEQTISVFMVQNPDSLFT